MATKANDKCSFAKISENNKDWCNGRGKPLALRKASGIVRKISLMVRMGNNPHRLADRKVANMPAFDISHNKAEFSTLSFVCKPPPLFRGEAWMPEVERPKALSMDA